MASWNEPKDKPQTYWDLWQGTGNPYALLAFGRSLDFKVKNLRVKKEKVT